MPHLVPHATVAVFCGSSFGGDPAYRLAAEALGTGLARAGIRLVYGGGRIGLMGALADAVLHAGGEVVGVLPEFLRTAEIAHDGLTRLEITDSMHARKRRMFELADFSDRSRWPEAIVRALRERPAPAAPELAKRLPTMMLRLLDDVVATELVPGMTLAKLNPARRMNELEFLFTASSLDFSALRNLLTTHGYPDVALEPGALRGFVKGFIDMIVEHDGKFWIVDWKSNHLGDTPADYTAVPLEAAMAGHAYHLQALLYTVALHRYLKARLRDYAYDEHIGGYLYLFVRGVRPGWRDGSAPTGVHARQPDERLVMALDALMDGRAA